MDSNIVSRDEPQGAWTWDASNAVLSELPGNARPGVFMPEGDGPALVCLSADTPDDGLRRLVKVQAKCFGAAVYGYAALRVFRRSLRARVQTRSGRIAACVAEVARREAVAGAGRQLRH